MLTLFGVAAATTMVISYALEDRGAKWIAVFAAACAATAAYGAVSGAWVFAVLEAVWSAVALRRFMAHRVDHDLRVATRHRQG